MLEPGPHAPGAVHTRRTQRGHASGLPRLQPEESRAPVGLGQSTGAGPDRHAGAPAEPSPLLCALQSSPPPEDGLLQKSSPWVSPSLVVIPPKQRPLNACLINTALLAWGHREPAARTALT